MRFKLLLLIILSARILYGQVEPPSSEKDFLKVATEVLGKTELEYVPLNSGNMAKFFSDSEKRYFVQSSDFVNIRGYSGYTNLGIVFDEKLIVKQVSIVKSQDTPGYVRRINRSKFFSQFENFTGQEKLDIISGATITTKTINETVMKTQEILREVFLN